jgi:RNA polymerase sigma-70 factor (ECF subfamily)
MNRHDMSNAASTQAAADTRLAAVVKQLLAQGQKEQACERFAEIVDRHQRRAARIAYYYLKDPADVDDAVQDAFLKAFLHLSTFRDDLVFEIWFTRIVINGCLDRLKARVRRSRWLTPAADADRDLAERHIAPEPSPEDALLTRERQAAVAAAVDRLPDRQRAVVVLTHFEGHSPREVSALLGISEATVRVHLFRAVRALRKLLRSERWLVRLSPRAQEARQR